MKARLENLSGIYVGDICYALEDKIYYNIWGKTNFSSGKYETDNGFEFVVADTFNGEGIYSSQNADIFTVESGNIGVVDLKIVDKDFLEDSVQFYGKVYNNIDAVDFECEHGLFIIKLYEKEELKETIEINTQK